MENKIERLIKSKDYKKILSKIIWKDYLKYILNEKEKLKWKKWFALDIDETLSATNIKWFEEMLEIFGNPERLTPEDAAKKYWLAQNIPYFKNNVEIENWMHQKIQDNDFQVLIPLIGNSNEIYREIHEKHINISLYITARPESVKNWTEKWLKNHNFPDADIILRPDNLDHKFSNLWKACVLEILYPEINWIVDDNPELIKYISEDYRWIICAYTHNLDFWRKNVISCLTHDDVKKNLAKRFPK